MAGEIATAFVRVRPNTAGFKGELHTGVAGAIGSVSRSVAGTALAVAGGLGVASLITGIGRIGIAYSDAMNTFQAVTSATKAQMAAAGAEATRLGNDLSLPSTSAADAGEAMTELAKAGLSVKDSIAAARGSLQLATAANTDAGNAAKITAGALNAFNLSGTQASRVADVFAAAANSSASEITDLAEGFQSAAGVSHQAGFAIQDLATVLAEMSNQGFQGAVAGTSFRSLLLNLESPTKKQSAALKQMNVHLYDQQGRMLPLVKIIGQFERAGNRMTQAQRNANFQVVAGTYGLQALNVLTNAGVAGFTKQERAVTKHGAAAIVAAARSRGLGGALRGLQSTLETTALVIYQRAAPGLERFVRGVAQTVSTIATSKRFADVLSHGLDDVGQAFSLAWQAARVGGPILLSVAGAAREVVDALGGIKPLLVGLAVFKGAQALGGLGSSVAGVVGRARGAVTGAATAETATTSNEAAIAQQRLAVAVTEATAALNAQAGSAGRSAAELATLSASSSTATAAFVRQGEAAVAAGAATTAATGEAAVASSGRLASSIRNVGTNLVGMVGKANLVAGAVALAAYGFYRLSQQANDTRRAMNDTADAAERIAHASSGFRSAGRTLAGARADRTSDRITRDQALLSVGDARIQLANDRAKGASARTLARDILGVREATNSLHEAQQRVNTDDAKIVRGNRDKAQSARAFQQDVSKLSDQMHRLAGVAAAANGVAPVALRARNLQAVPGVNDVRNAERQAEAVRTAAQAFDQFAAAQVHSHPAISRSAQLLAQFVRVTHTVPNRATILAVFNDATARRKLADATAEAKKKRSVVFDVDTHAFDGGLSRVLTKANQVGAKKLKSELGLTTTPFDTALTTAIKRSFSFGNKTVKPKADLNLAPFTAAIGAAQGIAASRGPAIGSALSSGIASGISSSSIAAALVGAVDRAAAAARAHAGIHSPSTLYRDLIGIPLAQGIGVGLNGLPEIMAGKLTKGIRDAITSAKQQLQSVGSTLSGIVGQFIDARAGDAIARVGRSPAAQRVAAINAQLDAEQRARDLAQRQQAVTDAQAAIAGAADPQALAAAQAQLVQAQADLADTQLSQERDALQASLDQRKQAITDEADARKTATEQSVNDLNDALNRGLISQATYNRSLARILARDGINFRTAARELGISFGDSFVQAVRSEVAQASAIVRGPRAPGGGFFQAPVSPLDDLRTELAAARTKLSDDLKAAKDKSGPGGAKLTSAESRRVAADRDLLDRLSSLLAESKGLHIDSLTIVTQSTERAAIVREVIGAINTTARKAAAA